MKHRFLLLFLFSSFSYAQFSFLKPYEIEVTSNFAFQYLSSEKDQLKLGLEAQEWSVEILKYWLNEMRKNRFISGDQKINFILYDSQRKRKIVIQIPVKSNIVIAFKTEAGFRENYIGFINDTYEWILENL
jgi:hypothetical protein